MSRLENKFALITGAASGMGRAIAKEFVENGAKVALVDVNAEGLKQTASKIAAEVLLLPADISLGAEVARVVKEAEEQFGRIDILVNCAGIHDHFVPVQETSDEVWEKIMAVNLRAPFQFTRAVLPAMLARKSGNIINVTSAASLVGGGGGTAYTASKHGALGLTRQTAVETAKLGIRTNAILPGAVASGMTEKMLAPGSEGRKLAEEKLIGRIGRPEEVAKVALFLASDDSSFVVGAAYTVDGGWSVT